MANLSHQANPISENTYPALHRSHGQYPHAVGDDQQGGHLEGVPRPVGNAVMQGDMQYPRQIDVPNYNMTHYHPPPPHYPEVPNLHIHRDVGGAEVVPAQVHPQAFAPGAHDNQDGLYDHGVHLPAAGPPEAFPGVQPHVAPPADMPPANGLRNLAGRFLTNPETLINVLRIEPGPGGRFVVWIELELADF